MPLFVVAMTRKPTKEQAENGAEDEIILAPTAVFAKDNQAAAVKAAVVGKVTDTTNVDVQVRPF